MNNFKYEEYPINIEVNHHNIKLLRIGNHYLGKHSSYMNDELILELVYMLNGHSFEVDSLTKDIEYYVADVEYGDTPKIYRLVFLIGGEDLEILGIVNAYRRKPGRKK
ncbi:MAG: hypothetical protein A2504_01070 [Bdellovibrionales bacterium RIFOXYD12_FULL_39_22]|nr:MAG: hypothetical protein A2385_01960 [Bdellovibrionales bacterium RIFOXYB1_FULL_39_21]OFZ42698.1 MAG: hypothetical protein A2485_10145 [Bdellovibrionales bacterium RIFOXYC12_FULL_39_17]OFZ47257.1 MAG: hypothetical protein A2404_14750 [Bdellovibrionales bacterium RIFOXYC1_FULL_39_130]OFZ73670.1 MAG: hypothetical protein A2451_01290 [Bdellovibrionales bacterium RIFOXYC2_FULL_39_8]OFZ75423.1 MAG: hypothetical protein A2560_04020 [Bdellovibrionales bacterium RIFOXYD1_FULL_39_84]OFZ93377.1 MAG: